MAASSIINNINGVTYKPKRECFKLQHEFKISWSMTSTLLAPSGIDRWDGELKFVPRHGGGQSSSSSSSSLSSSSSSGSSDREKKVGSIVAYKIGKEIDPKNYAIIFDYWCQYEGRHMDELAILFGRKNGAFLDENRNDVGNVHEIFQCSKLYIENVEVTKEFQGLGLGLFMVDEACRKINNPLGTTILCPTPRQSWSWVSKDAGIQKLRSYFSLLGFQPLGDKLLARWKGKPINLPDLQKVCPHLFLAANGKEKLERKPLVELAEEQRAKVAKTIGWKCGSCGYKHQFLGGRCMMCKKKRLSVG